MVKNRKWIFFGLILKIYRYDFKLSYKYFVNY